MEKELVASIRKYTTRDDIIEWLGDFPTKYKPDELNRVFNKPKDHKYLLWSADTVFDPKSSEIWMNKGVITL